MCQKWCFWPLLGYPYLSGQIEGGIMLLYIGACVWFLGGFGGMWKEGEKGSKNGVKKGVFGHFLATFWNTFRREYTIKWVQEGQKMECKKSGFWVILEPRYLTFSSPKLMKNWGQKMSTFLRFFRFFDHVIFGENQWSNLEPRSLMVFVSFVKIMKNGVKKVIFKTNARQKLIFRERFMFLDRFFQFLKFWWNPCLSPRRSGIWPKLGGPGPWGPVFWGFFQNGSKLQRRTLEIFRFFKNRKKRVFWQNPCTPIQGVSSKKTWFFVKNRKISRVLLCNSISFFQKQSKNDVFSVFCSEKMQACIHVIFFQKSRQLPKIVFFQFWKSEQS